MKNNNKNICAFLWYGVRFLRWHTYTRTHACLFSFQSHKRTHIQTLKCVIWTWARNLVYIAMWKYMHQQQRRWRRQQTNQFQHSVKWLLGESMFWFQLLLSSSPPSLFAFIQFTIAYLYACHFIVLNLFRIFFIRCVVQCDE